MKLMFGTAYYPEYMPYDRIQKDIEMMRDAGMNTARIAESTWSTLEPRDGIFNFHFIDRTLDALEEAGMMAVIGTPTYAVPAWLVRKEPNVMVRTGDGRALYGHRQKMDIMNPAYRFHAERMIRELVCHTAGRSCVKGYQIDNETKHYGTSGPEVQLLFREHLKAKYGSPEELNRAFCLAYWSNSIHDWADMPDMDGCVNGGLAAEYDRFRRSLAAGFLQWQSKLVRTYKREEQFITHNLDFAWKKFGADIAQDGYSYGIQPDMDHAKAAKCLSVVGTDIYHPTQDDLTGAEIAFCGDEIRSLKNQNYLVLECQAQAFKYWTPYPGQLRLHAYSHLASGGSGLLYWNWHSIHNGYETYWKGLLSHDLSSNPAYEEAAVIGREWEQIGAEHLVLQKKNQVALLVDNHTLTSFQWFPIDRDLSYNDVVRWMYDSLYEMNVECDIIHAEELCVNPEKSLRDYRMVITPALYSADESLIEQLKAFTAGGGVLVSSFKSFVADRNLSVCHDMQPHGMTACFGMSYQQFTEPGRTRLAGREVTYFAELLQADTAEVLEAYEHPCWNRYAGITRNAFGTGSAYYVGCYTDKETLKNIYAMALKDAGIRLADGGTSWPVMIRGGVNGLGKTIHYLLHYSETQTKWNCPFDAVTDLLTGREYRNGDCILLKGWDAVVLEEMERKERV